MGAVQLAVRCCGAASRNVTLYALVVTLAGCIPDGDETRSQSVQRINP